MIRLGSKIIKIVDYEGRFYNKKRYLTIIGKSDIIRQGFSIITTSRRLLDLI